MTLLSAGRTTVIFFSTVLLFTSCKKSEANNESSGGNFIRFTLDGNAVAYKSVLSATPSTSTDGSSSTYALQIDGYLDSSAAPANHLSVIAFSNTAITAGNTFADPAKYVTLSGSKAPVASVTFQDVDQKSFISLGVAVSEDGTPDIPGIVANAAITVTELGANNVKGTFSGTVYLTSDASFKSTHAFTEGSFSLPIRH